MMKYRIGFADDHVLARRAIRGIIENDPVFQIVGEATNGLEAVRLCDVELPEVFLMDIHMPVMNGLEAVRHIKQKHPAIKVVMLTVSDDAADLFTALQYGAQGYLLKNMDPDDWLSYLHALIDDNVDFTRQIADQLFHRFRPGGQINSMRRDDLSDVLTKREQQILAHIANGETNREIANQLMVTENTIKNHIKNMLDKLKLENRVQLTVYAIRHGLTHFVQNTDEK